MKVILYNAMPEYETVKRDGRRKKPRGARGNVGRRRVKRGQARARWAVETPLGPICGRTRAEALRKAGPTVRWLERHQFVLPE